MTEREFLERVELTLRQIAETKLHVGATSKTPHITTTCERCRLERLADEAADRLMLR